MLTRRAVLTGTAAASIAAIAAARDSAWPASSAGGGFDLGFGSLGNGGLAAFNQDGDGFGLFIKWSAAGAEVFFKTAPDGVEVFKKTFVKGWSPVTSSFIKFLPNLDGAEGSFSKFDKQRAEFLITGANQIGVMTTVEITALDSGETVVLVDVEEVLLGGD